MNFVKMHGLSNDFVVVDESVTRVTPKMVSSICDRRTGVGADGILRVSPSSNGVKMEYWNADGTPAEMCGNGLRCVARYAFHRELVDRREFVVLTPEGPRQVTVEETGLVRAEIGAPVLGGDVEVGGASYRRVSVGNPHAVRVVDDLELLDVPGIGAVVETNHQFPNGTNVEFVRLDSDTAASMRVWERGVGETSACGTGMVAVAATMLAESGSDAVSAGVVQVEVRGGVGQVEVDSAGLAWLTGPAVTVFEGELSEPF